MDDLYAVLEVRQDASPREVRAAYRALARRFHPDRNPGDNEGVRRMQEINEAYNVLSTPEHRREYDLRRRHAERSASTDIRRGAGRSPRPYYYRGHNWGLHAGADEPPAYIVRATPAGISFVATAGERAAHDVEIFNDAPFPVYIRVQCSPWLVASSAGDEEEQTLAIPGGGTTTISIAIEPEISSSAQGWRDGGVSLDTDDPRVFCPDIRVSAVFLATAPVSKTVRAADATKCSAEGNPAVEGSAVKPRGAPHGWLRRFLRL